MYPTPRNDNKPVIIGFIAGVFCTVLALFLIGGAH
jgi:hypothetical protein